MSPQSELKAARSALALNPEARNAHDAKFERDERRYSDIVTDALPALQKRVAEAKRQVEADEVERETREAEAESKRIATKEIPGLETDFRAVGARLGAVIANSERVAKLNGRRTKLGLSPIEDGETRARTTPGRTEPAEWETRDVWRRPSDGATPSQFVRGRDGEMRPVEAGYAKVRERVCIHQERHIAPQRPNSFAETVVLPGLKVGDPPIFPPKGGAC